VKKQIDEVVDVFENGTPQQKGELVGGIAVGAFNVEALILKGVKLAARATLIKAALKSCLSCRTLADGTTEVLSLASATNRLKKLEQSAPFIKAIAADQSFDAVTREAIERLLADGEDIEIIALSDGKRIMTKGSLSLDLVQRVQVFNWENYIVSKRDPVYGLAAAKATAHAADELTAGKSLREVLGAAAPGEHARRQLEDILGHSADQIEALLGTEKPGLAVERQSLALQLRQDDAELFGVPRQSDTFTPVEAGKKYGSLTPNVPDTGFRQSFGPGNEPLTRFESEGWREDKLSEKPGMTHPIAALAPGMDNAEKCFQRAMDRAAKPDDIIQAVGEMHFWLAHAQPFYRGTAAIADWVTRAVLDARGFEVGRLKAGEAADLKALSMSDPVAYGKQYQDMFEQRFTRRAELPPQHVYLRAFSYNGKIVKIFDPPLLLKDVDADVAREAIAVDATLPK
jgi:avirulence protein